MLAAIALAKDVHDPWCHWTDLALDEFVEFSEVRNPAFSAVLFWNDEDWNGPLGCSALGKHSDLNQTLQFVLECLQV